MAPNSKEGLEMPAPSSNNSALSPTPQLGSAPISKQSTTSSCQDSNSGSTTTRAAAKTKHPKLGPDPTLLSRREVDALYDLLAAVTNGLNQLQIPYILTGGSLLGATRQHSILFCDDDIDLAILETNHSRTDNHDRGSGSSNNSCNFNYERAKSQLPAVLGPSYQYSVRPWEGGDKVRIKSCSNVFLDVFVIRKYENMNELREVIGVKKNGDRQSEEYVKGVVDVICEALHNQGERVRPLENAFSVTEKTLELPCPIWHFNTRKAIELWPREVYRDCELFPTISDLKMGPVVGLAGPRMPVWLLKRAFGSDCFDVYYQSMSHGCGGGGGALGKKDKKHNKVEEKKGSHNECNNNNSIPQENEDTNTPQSNEPLPPLPPLVGAGGQWTESVKAPLSDEHYLPMQPMSRTRRRHTMHNKTNLFEYLKNQSKQERQWLVEAGIIFDEVGSSWQCNEKSAIERSASIPAATKDLRNGRTVYMDGVFDLFHIGHLHAIQQCAALGTRVIIGITGDEDASGYKRRPIISESDRTSIIRSLKVVDDIVCPCPLIVTKEFIEEWRIDLVVHGFADPCDLEKQREFFQYAMDEGKFQEIEYYSEMSTTDIIRRISSDLGSSDDGDKVENNEKKLTVQGVPKQLKKNRVNPKWFGAALAAATDKAPYIPYDPFPLELRQVIEPQLRKSTKKRDDALDAIREATGAQLYNTVMSRFELERYSEEGMFNFDTKKFQLRDAFLKSCGVPAGINLSRLHEQKLSNLKEDMMLALTSGASHFQNVYDEFVRSICAPFVASMARGDKEQVDEIYYQSFPCVRVVQPSEFSIGPHSDCAYGHHPCSINFYIPLTQIGGSASLFLESRPGSEDWHPIEGDYGMVKYFAGAICAHWTPENHGDYTRVSLDFRLIPGPMFHALKCGGTHPGGVKDVYRQKEGYYNCCRPNKEDSKNSWVRDGSLKPPDARVGFPWTKVKSKSKK